MGAPGSIWSKLNTPSYLVNFSLQSPEIRDHLVFSPDGKRVLCCEDDHTLKLWDIGTGIELQTFQNKEGSITCADISADGAQVVTGGSERIVRIWEVSSGKQQKALFGHLYSIQQVKFLLNGSRVLSLDGAYAPRNSKNLKLWDPTRATPLLDLELPSHSPAPCYSLSQDETRLAAGMGEFKLYDTRTGGVIQTYRGHPESISALLGRPVSEQLEGLTLSPDGSVLVSWVRSVKAWGMEALKLWRADRPTETRQLQLPLGICCCLSADNRFLVDAAPGIFYQQSGHLRVVEIATGRVPLELDTVPGSSKGVLGHVIECGEWVVANSRPDIYWSSPVRLETGSARILHHWNGERTSEVLEIKGEKLSDFEFAVSSRGDRIATLESGGTPGGPGRWQTIRVWDAHSGREAAAIRQFDQPLHWLMFAPTAECVISFLPRSTAFFLGPKPAPLEANRHLGGDEKSVIALSPDGGTVAVREKQGLRLKETLGEESLAPFSQTNVTALSAFFSPDGRKLAVQELHSTQWQIWNLKSAKSEFAIEGARFHHGAFSQDGKYVLLGGVEIGLYRIGSGKLWSTNCPRQYPVGTVAFSRDGTRVATADTMGGVKLWYTSSGREVASLLGQAGAVQALAFSPDGAQLATGAADGRLALWNAKDGQLVCDLPTHRSAVRCLDWSSDGQTLVAGGDDRTISIWNTGAARRLMRFGAFPSGVRWVRFLESGRSLIAVGKNNEIKIWNVARLKEAARELLQFLAATPTAPSAGQQKSFAPLGNASGFTTPELRLRLDCGSGQTLELVRIPAGHFIRNGQAVHFASSFYLGRCEVTQGQWEAVMGLNPSEVPGDPLLPVDSVSWEDCQNFCRKLSAICGRKVRLPSEAEWEYAFRAGSSSSNPDDFSGLTGPGDIGNFGWTSENADGVPHPVAGKRPNAWGLCDMVGNLSELCQDKWHLTFVGAPADGSAWMQGESHNERYFRIVRGTAFKDSAAERACRARRELSLVLGEPWTGLRIAMDESEAASARPPNPEPRPARLPPFQIGSRQSGAVNFDLGGGVTIGFVEIPPGSFIRGKPASLDDQTNHLVTLSRFLMSQHEISNAQYRRFNPRHHSGEHNHQTLDRDDQPAVNMSYFEVATPDPHVLPIGPDSFCVWLGKRIHRKVRLPTEAEWEYAARAGTATKYWWGDQPDAARFNVADHRLSALEKQTGSILPDDGYAVSAPVGSYPPNAWGLYDMHGNVREWCVDYHGEYPQEPLVNPCQYQQLGSRVVRGGSWRWSATRATAAVRDLSLGSPEKDLGFRVVIEMQ